jgi:hypothetical protein
LIRFEEHTYSDDPLDGHPDVRTRLRDAEYFFFGNGYIQGAVQHSPSGEGSPFGILIMDPEKLSMKRNALTMEESEGLSLTSLLVSENDITGCFDNQGTIRWKTDNEVPVIEVLWKWSNLNIIEQIYCSDRKTPGFTREIHIDNLLTERREINIKTSVPGKTLDHTFVLHSKVQKKFYIYYSIIKGRRLDIELINKPDSEDPGKSLKINSMIKSDNKLLEKFFNVSAIQLSSMISANGKTDASIWQYNREWVRDHSFMCLGLIYTGHFEIAETFLERLLSDFVSEEGDTIDSSEKRNHDEVELDQNGELLYTLSEYLKWTGDKALIERHIEKIIAVAEFPLNPAFFDYKSGLLHNSRDFWERHSIHGITDGFEFAYQMWVIKGLRAAVSMAGECGFGDPGKWENQANKLLGSLLDENKSGLIDKGGIIKRRDLNGAISRAINPKSDNGIPDHIPLLSKEKHLLNPDSSVSMAIVYDLIGPKSDLAVNSMATIEELWNQSWKGGGYGRYNVTSEPDSPGAWPFPSLFIARAYHRMGKYDKVERVLNWLRDIPGGNSCSWFENYGQRISPPYPQVGIPPWTWAEVIMLVIKEMLGVEPDGDFVRIKPALLPSISFFETTIRVREMIIDLKISRKGTENKTGEVLIPVVNERVSVSIEI